MRVETNDDSLIDRMTAAGLPSDRAQAVADWIAAGDREGKPAEAWARIYREVLTPAHDFALHQLLYDRCYAKHRRAGLPEPAWLPDAATIAAANVTDAAQTLGLADYAALYQWSIDHRERYWNFTVDRLGIRFKKRADRLVDLSEPTRPRWFPGAAINIVDSCFQSADASLAIIESGGNGELRQCTYGELRKLTARVANGLAAAGILPGDAVAVVMPMTVTSVAIYLGIIAAGASVVSIADSFAPEEIAVRLRVSEAKRVFTQDSIAWGAKRLPLFQKIAAAGAPPAMVLGTEAGEITGLRAGDCRLETFLSENDELHTVARPPQAPINILFSSGTTGTPKAIPWDHTTPIKCAADAHFHQDVHPGDVVCWPTSLGWMMGPWLITAALINRATIALFQEAPTGREFGEFVVNARVTLLGLVPSLVRKWRQTECMRGLDWSGIRAFSSSGECSNPGDMLYLMHLAGYRPIIEYCGGTEIGGGYLTETVVQPCVPSAFSTPALGIALQFETDAAESAGTLALAEARLIGPSIGLSTRLLNGDHDALYFPDPPEHPGEVPTRRHGDEVQELEGGYYRVVGRCDDSMNLGGIKVGCAEIERTLNTVPGVRETVAIAVAPPGGGPSKLVIFAIPVEPGAETPLTLKSKCQDAIRRQLNPLFAVDEVRLVSDFPRTASNKVMRRKLRDTLV